MAIDPPSDIVLEVARAADPTRAAAVMQRLNALSAYAPPAGADFAGALRQAAAETPPPNPDAVNLRTRLLDPEQFAADKASKAKVQFEATLLNSFIGEMLPKNASEAYGQGTAGDMWRSMLSEKISDQIAKSGMLGISRRLFEGRGASAASQLTRPVQPSAADHPGVTLTSANDLSLPSTADDADGSYLFSRGKSI